MYVGTSVLNSTLMLENCITVRLPTASPRAKSTVLVNAAAGWEMPWKCVGSPKWICVWDHSWFSVPIFMQRAQAFTGGQRNVAPKILLEKWCSSMPLRVNSHPHSSRYYVIKWENGLSQGPVPRACLWMMTVTVWWFSNHSSKQLRIPSVSTVGINSLPKNGVIPYKNITCPFWVFSNNGETRLDGKRKGGYNESTGWCSSLGVKVYVTPCFLR